MQGKTFFLLSVLGLDFHFRARSRRGINPTVRLATVPAQFSVQRVSTVLEGASSAAPEHPRTSLTPSFAGVLLPDGTNVNHALVKDGWCWWYRKDAPGNKELESLEAEARDGKRGLWADPHPVPPWEWRKRSK